MMEILDARQTWEALQNAAGHAQNIQIGIAYITNDQFQKLLPSLKKAVRRKSSQIAILSGIGDMNAQSPEALKILNEFAKQYTEQVTFGLVAPTVGIFHPKFYYFDDGKRADVFVGSSNLTSRAFATNIECNLHLSLPINDPIARQCRSHFKAWMKLAKNADAAVQDYSLLEALCREADQLQQQIQDIFQRFGQNLKAAPLIPDVRPRPDAVNTPIADILGNGFIAEVKVSAARFYLTVDSRQLAGTKTAHKRSGSLELVDQHYIRWSLLDKEDVEKWDKLYNRIRFDQRNHGVSSPWGLFLNEANFSLWLAWVKERDLEMQSFENDVIKKLKGRQSEKMQEFKRDFYRLFPKESKTKADAFAREVKKKYNDLVIRQVSRQSIVQPRWRSAYPLAFPAPLPVHLEAGLEKYAELTAEKTKIRDLATFAFSIARNARVASTTTFRPKSQKTNILDSLLALEQKNFHGDIWLADWITRARSCADTIPNKNELVSPRTRDKKEAKAQRDFVALLKEAQSHAEAVEQWDMLSPEQVLLTFAEITEPIGK
jgi:HKD family nuclease